MAHNGKIARLPYEIREALNRRLQDNEPGGTILTWLNADPVVLAVLAREFDGRAITKQNLYEWRANGFIEWQTRQQTLAEVRKLASDATELAAATGGQLTNHLTTVVAARYASVLAGWNGEVTEIFRRKLRALRGLCQDIAELQRGHHSGARLKIEQERLEREREKTEEELFEQFKQWAKKSEMRDCLCRDWVSFDEQERRLREQFGLPPEPPEKVPPPASGSNPVKPSKTKSDPIQPDSTNFTDDHAASEDHENPA
jgi:hypothetical protein